MCTTHNVQYIEYMQYLLYLQYLQTTRSNLLFFLSFWNVPEVSNSNEIAWSTCSSYSACHTCSSYVHAVTGLSEVPSVPALPPTPIVPAIQKITCSIKEMTETDMFLAEKLSFLVSLSISLIYFLEKGNLWEYLCCCNINLLHLRYQIKIIGHGNLVSLNKWE